eukprot:scaffold72839_cov27-Phaeocystis_antarctica.AAC.1
MILSQPGAWSAEPNGLLPGPWNFGSLTRNIMPLVLREARRSWRLSAQTSAPRSGSGTSPE